MKLGRAVWALALGLGLAGCGPSPSSSPRPSGSKDTNPSAPAAATARTWVPVLPVQASDLTRCSLAITTNAQRFNLPASFQKALENRVFLDLYEAYAYALAEEVESGPRLLVPVHSSSGKYVRILHSTAPAPVLSQRKALTEKLIPLRGYRAGILDQASSDWPALPPDSHAAPALQQAAAVLDQDLARAGLLPTLVRIIEILGAPSVQENPARAVIQLRSAGFPADLLSYFRPASLESPTPERWLAWVAAKLAGGQTAASLAEELRSVPYQFQPSLPGFQPVLESAGVDIGTVRMQIGGGYRNGIIPGGSIDIAAQLVAAMPKANFVLSVPAEFLGDLREMAGNYWPLKRPGQITLVAEPMNVTAWAQDNGKSGLVQSGAGGPASLATLVPRYACQGEAASELIPGDTFLAEGLHAAGQVVAQSPLLFQGGNLMPVEDPATGQRWLLLGEAELHRNTALGLSTNQALESFRAEFAADRCVVVPVVSFHIDFDVSLRLHQGRMLAFVNDPLAASRLMIERGLEILAKNHAIPESQARQIASQLAQGDAASAHAALSAALARLQDSNKRFPTGMIRWFAHGAEDAAALNLRFFLLALDLMASQGGVDEPIGDSARRPYWAALREMETASRAQTRLFQSLGWTVIPVPSMPDVASGINYLNGLHDASRYFMPAHGGLYQPMDEAAARAFSQALGPKIQIVPIMTLESQKQHGAIHCAASIYPKIPATHSASGEPNS